MMLNTSYLIDLLEREQPTFEKGMELYRNAVATRVSMASVFELFYGAAVILDDEERFGLATF